MHYIIGASFNVPRNPNVVTPHTGVTSLTQPAPPVIVKEFSHFKPGTQYTLHYIERLEDGLKYLFRGSDGDIVDLQFESASQGDEFIAKLKSEELPDYSKIYKNRHD